MARFDRGRLIAHQRIAVVFDIGANVGQYAEELRALGYRGRIVSCEPLAAAYRELAAKAARDPQWEALHVALGEAAGRREMHVAANSQSSSLLEMHANHVAAAPHATYEGSEAVEVTTLDAIFDRYVRDGERVLVKLDVQGYERFVLAGARASVPRVHGVQLEMSLVPLYEGEALFPELLAQMTAHGFQLMGIEPVLVDRETGQLLAVDGMFFRPEVAA
ncbi:MAG TPA: FkbM family methyltransferase [Kofleriaceae bacterium]|nr:FkbM family methyltransferase [Kofleriaceae bacterium]